LLLAKQIITLYHAAQKPITKDQHALVTSDALNPLDAYTVSFPLVITRYGGRVFTVDTTGPYINNQKINCA
ncbi:hypothetical protein J5X92_19170, partial [Alteromonas sp. K632G]|uniref:hypothetical protein n=1 Tax=Alteromonas sp. K632G TaxID=2820757 RepID=UPI001AD6ECE0